MAANGFGQPVVPVLELVTKGQDLAAELSVRPTLDDQGFQHQTDNGVGKRKKHDGRGSQKGDRGGEEAPAKRQASRL
jgi:hypothetical protein